MELEKLGVVSDDIGSNTDFITDVMKIAQNMVVE